MATLSYVHNIAVYYSSRSIVAIKHASGAICQCGLYRMGFPFPWIKLNVYISHAFEGLTTLLLPVSVIFLFNLFQFVSLWGSFLTASYYEKLTWCITLLIAPKYGTHVVIYVNFLCSSFMLSSVCLFKNIISLYLYFSVYSSMFHNSSFFLHIRIPVSAPPNCHLPPQYSFPLFPQTYF